MYSTKAPVAAPPTPPILQKPTQLYHLGSSSLAVQGHVTGFTYLFAGRNSSLAVDERDVPALLATQRFSLDPAS